MGRAEKFRFGLAKEKRLFKVIEEEGWSTDEVNMAESLLGSSRFSLCRPFSARPSLPYDADLVMHDVPS